MRRRAGLLAGIGAAVTLLFCLTAASAWANWSSPYTFPSNDMFMAVGFADENVGWVVGSNGSDGFIKKTTDGGATWTTQDTGTHLVGNGAQAIAVIDSQTVMVSALNNKFLTTTDGGATWTGYNAAFDSGWPRGMSFIDASTGWVCTIPALTNPQVYKTTNGGSGWTAVTPPGDNGVALAQIDFYDANNGLLVGDLYNGTSNFVWRTTDGGTSWTAVTLPTAQRDYMQGLVNLDATHAWAVGDNGAIFFSGDGGASWTRQQAVNTSYSLCGVDFVDAQNGWAVGSVYSGTSVILHTADGGVTWTRQTTICSDLLVAVDFIDARNGYAVSEFDDLLKATNGGAEVGGSVTIDNGASSTASTGVLLYSAVDGATEMRFSNDEGATWSEWESYAAIKVWALEAGTGTRTVTAQYRDAGSGFLETSDTIQLDGSYPSGMLQIANGASSTADLEVWLYHNVSGATEMRLRNAGGSWSEWQEFQVASTWTLDAGGEATKTVEAEYRDGELDVLACADSILLDADAPSGFMEINDGSGFTNETAIAVYLDISGAAEMRFRVCGGAWSEWQSYAGSAFLTLPAGDGLKLVEGQFRDAEADTLDCAASVVLDTVDPSATEGVGSGSHPDPDTWYADDDPAFAWDPASDPGSGLAGYSYDLDQSPDTIPDTTVDGADTSALFEDLESGTYYFHVRAVDTAGNGGPTTHYTIRIDVTPPSTTDDAPSGAQSGPVTVTFSATDEHSGVAHTYYTVDGGDPVEGTSVEISAAGTTELTYWSVDAAGNTESANSVSVEIEEAAVITGSMTVNNGASVTASRDVLLFSDVAGATEMRFSNDGTTWSEWQAYEPLKVWSLEAGTGTKTVTAQYRDAGTGFLETSDAIELNAAYPSGMLQINGGASSTADLAVTLYNDVSGATEMRFRDSGGSWSEWEAFAATKAWTLPSGGEATKTVEAEYRDAEADVLACADAITVDADAPSGMLQVGDGSAYVKSAEVTLNMTVSGATEMRFRDSEGSWSEWEPYAATKSWTLAAGDGLKAVEGQFRDAEADLLSCPAFVTLDSSGPAAPSEVSASWIRLAGNSGRVSVTYKASEATQISPLLVTVTVKTGSGITKASATYSGESLDTVIAHTIATTLTKGTYRVTVSMADAAGNSAAGVATVVMAVN